MRKSPATIAAPSSTWLTARLSGTNHSCKACDSRSSSGGVSTLTSADVTRWPGALASQSLGKTSKSAGSKGRSPRPSMNTE